MTMTQSFPIQNVSCEACEKVIGRMLARFPHAKVESISPDARTLTVSCEEGDIPRIREKLRIYNYLDENASGEGHVWFTLSRILGNRPGFEAEHALMVQTLGLMVVLAGTLALAYLGWFRSNPSFLGASALFVLIPIGIAVNAGALLHVRQLREHFTCSSGMMAGMILGMIAGFMSGALIGATNGMFVGSLTGMGIGMGASAYAVRKSGIMSVLEGLMAGLMAGTMGAMLSVMMLNDHVVEFLYILFGVCTLIVGGMSYFLVKEIGPIHDEKKGVAFVPLALVSVLVLLALLALMVGGPKSTFVFGGVL